jgi:hypothetical protein
LLPQSRIAASLPPTDGFFPSLQESHKMIFEFLKNRKFGDRDTGDSQQTPYGKEIASAKDRTIIRD